MPRLARCGAGGTPSRLSRSRMVERPTIAELVQLPLDPLIAPARILACQTQDQRRECGLERGPPAPLVRPEGPFATHHLPMPAEDGRWRDEQAELLPE